MTCMIEGCTLPANQKFELCVKHEQMCAPSKRAAISRAANDSERTAALAEAKAHVEAKLG